MRVGYVGKKVPWLPAGLKRSLQQITFMAIVLHLCGERGLSTEEQTGDAFPQDAIREVIATGIKPIWGWRWAQALGGINLLPLFAEGSWQCCWCEVVLPLSLGTAQHRRACEEASSGRWASWSRRWQR